MTDVIWVDANDNEIGTGEKQRTHELGQLHRAFSVFILREHAGRQEVLLQQRARSKYHCGGLWTNTCCSHPMPGETTAHAANRRLQEEVGFTTSLREIGVFTYRAAFDNGLVEHEIDHVFIGAYSNQTIQPNPDEVDDLKWVGLNSLFNQIALTPEYFTPWLKPALEIVANAVLVEPAHT